MDEPYFSVEIRALQLPCRLRGKTTIYVAQYKQLLPAFFEIFSSTDELQCVKTRGFKYLVFHIHTVAESRPHILLFGCQSAAITVWVEFPQSIPTTETIFVPL